MTLSNTIAAESVVEVLRGDPSRRPAIDATTAAGLRAELEDGLFAILGAPRLAAPLTLRSSSMRPRAHANDRAPSARGQLRGLLVNQLLRLLSVGVAVDHAFGDALAAWDGEGDGGPLRAHFDQLDPEERARLATDVTAHAVTLSRALGPIPRAWSRRTALHATQRLAGGQVVLRDVVDLLIGSTESDVASVVLVDITTTPLGQGAERAMRYHALVQTLRTSLVPWRTAAFSTATGELWVHDVDGALLARSAHEVLDVVRDQWRAR